jgi:hypothetical protein
MPPMPSQAMSRTSSPPTQLLRSPLCRSKIRFSLVSCRDAGRSGSVVVFVYQSVEDGLSPDAVGLEVGGRGGRVGLVWR